LQALQTLEPQVSVPKETAVQAKRAIERMLAVKV